MFFQNQSQLEFKNRCFSTPHILLLDPSVKMEGIYVFHNVKVRSWQKFQQTLELHKLLPCGACFALYHKIYCVRYSNHWQIFLGHFLTFFDVKRPTNRWKMKNPCCSRLCFDRSVSSRADIWYTIICLISMLCMIILWNNFWLILLQIKKKILNSNSFQV